VVRRLDVVRAHFAGRAAPLVLISGTAASLAMLEAGLDLQDTPTSGAVLVRAHAYGINSAGRDSRN
jgi:hypothetical protein